MAKNKLHTPKKINLKNKKAAYEYELTDKYIAGMALTGTEIKSVREARVNIQPAYCIVRNGEVYIRDLHISPYKYAAHYNHDPVRERKLLLNKQEIKKLDSKSQEKGFSIIPLRIFINERGLAKMEIALGRGKKLHDKRHSIREKDEKREMSRLKY
jgi:SsrA-binding protein